jgi:hypothetical protein
MEQHDDHVLTYYVDHAMAWLVGRRVWDKNGLPKTEHLSQQTEPSESEARWALVTLLVRIRKGLTDERLQAVVAALTLTFADNKNMRKERQQQFPLKLVPKRRGTGHADPARDSYIAALVRGLRDSGDTREVAIGRVADMCGLDCRTIEKIYDRRKSEVSGDGTASDS